MSDILAGKTEIEKGLKVVIINAESLALRDDLKDKREVIMAVHMLKAALHVIGKLQ